jgi:hypothetical protein
MFAGMLSFERLPFRGRSFLCAFAYLILMLPVLPDLLNLFRMLFQMAGPAPIYCRIHGHIVFLADRTYDLVPPLKHKMAFPADCHAFREVKILIRIVRRILPWVVW